MIRPSINLGRLAHLQAALVATLILVPPASAAGPPANDHFVGGQEIAGYEGNGVPGFTLDATKEAGEPDHSGDPGGHSIWYRWTAPDTGQVRFSTTGSDFDTLLAIYTGDTVATLTPIAANDDSGGTQRSEVTFRVDGGTVYHLAVDGSGGDSGNALLSWVRVPANDTLASAQIVEGAFGSATGTNVNASREMDEPDHAGSEGMASVWYRWTAPESGRVKFDTEGSDFDTVLAVYTGTELGSLQSIGANDDSPITGCCASRVAFNASQGTTYQIAVDGFFGDIGSIVLNWSPLLVGTPAADRLIGTIGPEEILGMGGNDTILAGGGDDVVLGGGGNDTVLAGGGSDWTTGNSGSDVVDGGPGHDLIFDYWGIDRLVGRAGNDRIFTSDGHGRDFISGGLGIDRCFADRNDVRRGCP